MGTWDRAELQAADDRFIEVANQSAAQGQWGPWAEMFTEDAEYVEHHYGTFHGRAEILAWISATMAQWPNNEMTMFPHDWCLAS